jgi:hypothetical protein
VDFPSCRDLKLVHIHKDGDALDAQESTAVGYHGSRESSKPAALLSHVAQGASLLKELGASTPLAWRIIPMN